MRDIAIELATSFNAPIEKIVLEANADQAPYVFPRMIERIFQKTEHEIAESDALIPTLSPNGLLQDRPLTFMEIVEKISQLGYEIKPREEPA